ncbi:MAG: Fic family protein [Acetobacter sp.]|nr:Fic family protein [Bacteroides sp.]MCM1341633.1 Fic family protein [Acetobacter sp.]MCM1434046.1 Fic family protein [Clostridiales bacterium]
MADERNWQFELTEYIKQGEPNRAERSESWKTAIGLQDVDGLKTSVYLLDTAKEHIEGKIDIATVQKRVNSYYEQQNVRQAVEDGTEEADKVAARIAEMLNENTFQFSPAEFKAIHRRLFSDVFKHAGEIRTYNITKKEWVLKGDTVLYASFDSINDTLDYDFDIEKKFSYEGLSTAESVKHIAKFIAGIWQIHPFCEGNTRATAVFIIKYLKSFGFDVNNDLFSVNSWYFRNALVRANYNNVKNGIIATTKYLELFFENLLLGKNNELKNRYLHIDFQSDIQSDNSSEQNVTLDELALLKIISKNPSITQIQLAEKLGVTDRTIKRKMKLLQEKGLIQRINGKRNGYWKVLMNF